MTRSEQPAANDPALEKTMSADDAGLRAGGAAVDAVRLVAGTKLGRYEIVEFIGGGGMGWVYRAKDTELEREVAIKVVQPTVAGPKGRDRLLAEARAMAKLRHRAVVPVHDVGEYAGGVYVAMALVKGGTLHDWMHAEARPWRQVVARFLEAGRGLVAAHAAGIVHRDFKPRNVLMGEGGEVMVADFGIASASADGGDADGVAGGAREATSIVGTPAYMAPEQAAGQAVDARADQYSFCVSLWEGLHGQRPQEAETRTQGALLERSPAAPKSRRRVPGWLTDAVARGFAPDPEKRWPTLGALLDAVERRIGRGRRLAMLGGGAAAVAGIVVAVTWGATRGDRAAPCVAPGSGWSPAVQARLEASFRGTQSAIAEDVIPRLVRSLDAYATKLSSKSLAVCEVRRGERGPSELSDRRGLCLERRRDKLAELLATFERADRAVVAGALDAIGQLEEIEECDNAGRLRSLAEQPPPALRDPVAVVDGALAAGEELRRRGRIVDALRTYERALTEADRLRWPPAQAAALVEIVGLRAALGLAFVAPAQRLIEVASAADDDSYLVFGLSQLLSHYVSSGRLEQAAGIAEALRAALARDGVSRVMRVQGLWKLALLAIEQHDGPRAAGLLAEADRLAAAPKEKAWLVAAHAEVAGTNAARIQYAEEGLRITIDAVGPRDVAVGTAHIRLARLSYLDGDLASAERRLEAARAIFVDAGIVRASPPWADYLQIAGSIARKRTRFDESVRLLEDAVAVYRATGQLEKEAQVVRSLGNTEVDRGRPAEALRYFNDALALMARARGRDSLEYVDMEASLGIHQANQDCAEGVRLLTHARQILEPLRHPSLAPIYGQLGSCLEATDPDEAGRLYQAGLALCVERGCAPGTAENFRANLGKLLTNDPGTRPQGVALLREAREGFARLGQQRIVEMIDRDLAQIAKGRVPR
ncbi:MAG: protein kinase [Kofleriaceae bacterium]|nr:protein kinase [Kofleriaceae bacterium]